VINLRKEKKNFFLVSISVFLLLCVFGAQVNSPVVASSDVILVGEDYSTAQEAIDAASSRSIEVDETVARSFQENLTRTIQGGQQMLQSSSGSNSASFSRHMMCKDYELVPSIPPRYDPIDPTTIFRPTDTKAVCLTTISVDDKIEFRWHYRSNSSKTWVSCYNFSKSFPVPGEYHYAAWLLIAGYWPGSHYPRAYKVEVYLDDSPSPSFSEFFEVTNGGLNSPRICEDVDVDGNSVNIKSRFTIDEGAKAHHYLKFDKIAYFNEELGYCHNFTTFWIQPNGSTYKTYSGIFPDYKDTDVTWNYWEQRYILDDYISINSSTPVGNWNVEVYLDRYYFNNTWMHYGPIATTPFIVGSEPVADWTFMVYLDADNTLENASIEVFLKMASVGSLPQVNIVVQMDRCLGEDIRYGNWTDCKRFNVTKGMTPTPENAVEELGEVNMGDPSTLKNFVNWTINNYPANYYFLVLWDHGTGCMGFCFDVTNETDSLSLPELSQALSGLPAIMDVVLLDACSMSMTEVAYQIKDYANVLVGPEGLGYAPAPYDDYLSSLTSNPSMLPSAFAMEIVTDYINWCKGSDQIQNATMSATDLTKITSLTAAIDDFALELKENESFYNYLINLARNLTQGYPGPYTGQTGYYIDLYHFAQLTYQHVLDEELRNTANQVMTTIESIIIKEAHKAHPYSHGLSIFFPDEEHKYFHEDFETLYEETSFAEDTSWDEYVKYYLNIQTYGYVLAIQTPYRYISVKVEEKSYTTDAEEKIRIIILPGSYTVNVTTPVYNIAGPGSRGVFTHWNDSETNPSRTITVPGPDTYTANYKPQFYLTVISPYDTPDGEGWYYEGNLAYATLDIGIEDHGNGTRRVFTHWSDDASGTDLISNPITMDQPKTATASWQHQYRLIMDTNFGTTKPSAVPEHWYDAGSTVEISATSPNATSGEQYVWLGWTGTGTGNYSGSENPCQVKMNAPITEVASWEVQYYLTVSSVYGTPSGAGWHDEGSTAHATLDTETVNGTTGIRYLFTQWSDDASGTNYAQSDSITMDRPKTATANWKTQYYLTIDTGPAGLSPQPNVSIAGPWYDSGTQVNLTAETIEGYKFDHWDIDGTAQDLGVDPMSLTMDGPCKATAHYVRALAWWEALFRPERLHVILGLVGIGFSVTLVGTAWVIIRRRRAVMKVPAEPVPIEVSEVLPNRVPTGSAALDNLLFGGIPENYAVILTSHSCDERDLLIKRFLETGAKKGEVTFYVAIDPGEAKSLVEEFQPNFYLFICNPQADKIIESLPNVFKIKGVENLTDLGIALTKAFRRIDESITGPKRACIEIISDVLLEHHGVHTRRWLTDVITEFKSRGFTTLAVVNPKMHPSEEVHAILDLFEGEINIYERAREENFLKIKKMYKQRYLDSELPLKKGKPEK
jgi:KaiC/GvpD/RAD55 family RecA-like ATPase